MTKSPLPQREGASFFDINFDINVIVKRYDLCEKSETILHNRGR